MTRAREDDRDGALEAVGRDADEVRRELAAQTAGGADQTAADLDQTQADSDQAAADADQIASDLDQTLAQRDQHAADRDQAAADWLDSHGSPSTAVDHAHGTSRTEREAASRERDATAAARARSTAMRLATAARRDEVARVRDLTAAARDRTADARDEAATARDNAAEARERHAVESGDLGAAVAALKTLRLAGAGVRRQSALDRQAAATDRAAAAADRDQAAIDRRNAGLDDLTGVFRRGTGELALEHEIARARRTGEPLVLVMIDIDGLKAVNDNDGHAAGDALLSDVAESITLTLRSYDVTVRWGGDEFVCTLSDTSVEVAGTRIDQIRQALTARRPGASLSVGLALVDDGASLERVIAQADAELYRVRGERGNGGDVV